MLVWASLSLATLGGCGTSGVCKEMDHMAPRSVVVAMHQAIAAKNYDCVSLCIAPEYRGAMRSELAAWKEYSAQTLQTAALVEKRIDAAPAQRMRDELDRAYQELLPLPLAGAVWSDTVQWERVNIDAQKDFATLEIDHQSTPFGKKFRLVRVKGSWYVAPVGESKAFASQAKQAAQSYNQSVKNLVRLQSRIKKGQVNRDNVTQEFWPSGGEKPRAAGEE
jgi:hypothetical protein